MTTSHDVAKALEKRHRADAFFREVKNGPTTIGMGARLRILDAVAIKKSYTAPCITGYEIKISRGDFLRDDKWQEYMPLCHRFLFACPAGLLKPNEMPEGVGLIEVTEKGMTKITRRPLHRNIELPVLMFLYLVYSRTPSDRPPWFSGAQEELSAWLAEKQERKHLGLQISRKLRARQSKLEDDLAIERNSCSRLQGDYKYLVSILASAGLPTNPYDLSTTLRQLRPSGCDLAIASAKTLQRKLDELLRQWHYDLEYNLKEMAKNERETSAADMDGLPGGGTR